MQQILVLGLLSLLLPACAVGNTYDYQISPDLTATSSRTLAVGVQDKRTYVVTGDKAPNFVGLQRGGLGVPFDVTTTSGAPLAQDFATSIVDGLKLRNVKVSAVTIAPQGTRKDAVETLLGTGTQRSLLVTLSEWKSDTYANTALTYNLSAEVLDSKGTVLAENTLNGRRDIGGSLMDPFAAARSSVPAAYRDLLAELLNDKNVVDALK